MMQSSGRASLAPLVSPTCSRYSASSFFKNQGLSMLLQKNSAWHQRRTRVSKQFRSWISTGPGAEEFAELIPIPGQQSLPMWLDELFA